MRCKRDGCGEDAAPGQVYCSRNCAPLAHLTMVDPGKRYPSDEEIRGSIIAGGGRLNQPSRVVPTNIVGPRTDTTGIKLLASKNEKPLIENATNEERKIMPPTESNGTPGTPETNRNTVSRSEDENSNGTPLEDSSLSPSNLEKARSASMSLLDDAATHCLKYMKSIGRDCEAQGQLRDFRTINAVANLASQIADLAKVKLLAIKEAKRS